MTQERPILFSAPMVRAILDGNKTQTRRVVKPQPIWIAAPYVPFKTSDVDPKGIIKCPYGQPGDRLWIRETWGTRYKYPFPPSQLSKETPLFYKADIPAPYVQRWTPSIHMPRWASRIDLYVKNIRIERLQDISEYDAQAEGILCCTKDGELYKYGLESWPWEEWHYTAKDAFHHLWNLINGKDSWDENPWLWAVDFERIRP